MPTTQTAAPAAHPAYPLTEAEARTIAGRGRTWFHDYLRDLLEHRSGRQFSISWARDETAPFGYGYTDVRVLDEQPGDRVMFAALIGSCMGEVQSWGMPDDADVWASCLLRAAGQPNIITGERD